MAPLFIGMGFDNGMSMHMDGVNGLTQCPIAPGKVSIIPGKPCNMGVRGTIATTPYSMPMEPLVQ